MNPETCLARVTCRSMSSTPAGAMDIQLERMNWRTQQSFFLLDNPIRRQEARLSTCRQLRSLFAERLWFSPQRLGPERLSAWWPWQSRPSD